MIAKERAAELLADHCWIAGQGCLCGADVSWRRHPAHQAEVLASAGVIPESEEWAVQLEQGVHPGPFTEASAREWMADNIAVDYRRHPTYRGKQALLRRYVGPWKVVEP